MVTSHVTPVQPQTRKLTWVQPTEFMQISPVLTAISGTAKSQGDQVMQYQRQQSFRLEKNLSITLQTPQEDKRFPKGGEWCLFLCYLRGLSH